MPALCRPRAAVVPASITLLIALVARLRRVMSCGILLDDMMISNGYLKLLLEGRIRYY